MKERYLIVKWNYDYNKESTWYDEDSGEEQYELKEGAVYKLPHIREKRLEILSVTEDGDLVKAEIYVDYKTYTVSGDGEPVVGYAHHDYSVAGDSVSQTLCMEFTIK